MWRTVVAGSEFFEHEITGQFAGLYILVTGGYPQGQRDRGKQTHQVCYEENRHSLQRARALSAVRLPLALARTKPTN